MSCIIGKCETCGKPTTTDSYGKEFCSFTCLEIASKNFKPKEQEQIMGSCDDNCNHFEDIYNACKKFDEQRPIIVPLYLSRQKHSCYEPRKQEEKKTTWYLHTIADIICNESFNIFFRLTKFNFEEWVSRSNKVATYNLLSTKQIETSETDLKKIYELLKGEN